MTTGGALAAAPRPPRGARRRRRRRAVDRTRSTPLPAARPSALSTTPCPAAASSRDERPRRAPLAGTPGRGPSARRPLARPRGRTPCESRCARPPGRAEHGEPGRRGAHRRRPPRAAPPARSTTSSAASARGADDRLGIQRVDAGRQRTRDSAAIAALPGRDDHLVHARLAGELPGERVLARAAADDQRPRRRRCDASSGQPGPAAHRPPGPLDRLGPLRPHRHEHDRHAGELLDRARRTAGRSRAGRPATGRRGSARTSPRTARRSGSRARARPADGQVSTRRPSSS